MTEETPKKDMRATRPSGIKRRSAKAKGRRGVQKVQAALLGRFVELTPEDVFVKAGSQGGVDVHLSEAARRRFPYGIECKAVEALNIWAALQQASDNADGLTPILFFSRNHTPLYVALLADDFLRVIQ